MEPAVASDVSLQSEIMQSSQCKCWKEFIISLPCEQIESDIWKELIQENTQRGKESLGCKFEKVILRQSNKDVKKWSSRKAVAVAYHWRKDVSF